MATTIEALRNLGLKVNGEEPTSNNIGNVINEIAEEYTGGGGGSDVSIDNFKAGSGIVLDTDEATDQIVIMADQEVIPYKSDFKTINGQSILGTGQNIEIKEPNTYNYMYGQLIATLTLSDIPAKDSDPIYIGSIDGCYPELKKIITAAVYGPNDKKDLEHQISTNMSTKEVTVNLPDGTPVTISRYSTIGPAAAKLRVWVYETDPVNSYSGIAYLNFKEGKTYFYVTADWNSTPSTNYSFDIYAGNGYTIGSMLDKVTRLESNAPTRVVLEKTSDTTQKTISTGDIINLEICGSSGIYGNATVPVNNLANATVIPVVSSTLIELPSKNHTAQLMIKDSTNSTVYTFTGSLLCDRRNTSDQKFYFTAANPYSSAITFIVKDSKFIITANV